MSSRHVRPLCWSGRGWRRTHVLFFSLAFENGPAFRFLLIPALLRNALLAVSSRIDITNYFISLAPAGVWQMVKFTLREANSLQWILVVKRKTVKHELLYWNAERRPLEVLRQLWLKRPLELVIIMYGHFYWVESNTTTHTTVFKKPVPAPALKVGFGKHDTTVPCIASGYDSGFCVLLLKGKCVNVVAVAPPTTTVQYHQN